VFSPNGDTRRDTTALTYVLEQPQTADVYILNSAGTAVRNLWLGTNKATGTYTWTWNGKNNAGALVSNGTYRVELRTRRAITGGTIYGLAATSVRVDRTRPSLSGLLANPTSVYPFRDGYRDTTRLTVTTNEALSGLEARITNSAGTRVRTIKVGAQAAGTRFITWNGRNSSGTALPAGTYGYQLVATDLAANVSVSARATLPLSAKRLVAKTGVKTLTPLSSYQELFIGYCSGIYSPGRSSWTGSLGYYSESKCVAYYAGEDLAAARHSYTLPAAIRYGSVKVAAYGGSDTYYPDVAALIYYDRYGQLTDTGITLGSADGTRTAPTVSASSYLNGRTMSWLAGTTDYNWYDIKVFTVTWTYYVLQ
jgi:flagellar hook assembly protein FlgD